MSCSVEARMRLTRVASRLSAGESAKTGSDDEDGATGVAGDVSEIRTRIL